MEVIPSSQLLHHIQRVEEDIRNIEAGRVPLPQYHAINSVAGAAGDGMPGSTGDAGMEMGTHANNAHGKKVRSFIRIYSLRLIDSRSTSWFLSTQRVFRCNAACAHCASILLTTSSSAAEPLPSLHA